MRVLRFFHYLSDDVTAIRLAPVLSKVLSERRLSEELAQGILPNATVALDPLHDIVLALDTQCQVCGLRRRRTYGLA